MVLFFTVSQACQSTRVKRFLELESSEIEPIGVCIMPISIKVRRISTSPEIEISLIEKSELRKSVLRKSVLRKSSH